MHLMRRWGILGGAKSVMMTAAMLVGHWHSVYLNTAHGDGDSSSKEAISAPLQGGGRYRYRGGTGQGLNGSMFEGQNEVSGNQRTNPTQNIPTMSPYVVVNYEVIAG